MNGVGRGRRDVMNTGIEEGAVGYDVKVGERAGQAERERFENLVCENWLEADRICRREKCRYKHPLLCYGICKGNGCTRVHKDQAEKMLVLMRRERERVKVIKEDARKNNWCYGFLKGFCREGDRCRWKHPRDQVAPWVVERDGVDQDREEENEEQVEQEIPWEDEVGEMDQVSDVGTGEMSIETDDIENDMVEEQTGGEHEWVDAQESDMDSDSELDIILGMVERVRDEMRKGEN